MPKKYPWPTAGLQKYSERLKVFIHERCTCYPPIDDDMFEVPEFMVVDPLKRRPSKFKLSFADDFPYTRFKDNSYECDSAPCTCDICPLCDCNLNLKPFPHYVLLRDQLPQWVKKGEIRFKKPESEGPTPSAANQGMRQDSKDETAEEVEDNTATNQAPPDGQRRKISAFSFDDDPTRFPFL